jgi:hypothetical protein
MKKLIFVIGLAVILLQRAGGQYPTTPNLNLCLPPVGVSGWGPCYNANSSIIDAAIFALQHPVQGAWVSTTNYQPAQYVTYGGGVYLAAQASLNQTPSGSSAYWLLIAGSGSTTPGGSPYSIQYNNAGVLAGVRFNGLAVVSTSAAPRSATFTDIVNLWGGGCATSFLRGDGTCGGGVAYYTTPSSSVAVAGTMAAGYVAIGTGATTAVVRRLTLDDLGPAFSITGFSCSGCGNYEIGSSTTITGFSATYSSAAVSGTVTDGGSNTVTLSPPNSTSQSAVTSWTYPVTSGTVAVFTLTAVAATSPSAQASIAGYPCTFAGVGTAAATGISTTSGSATPCEATVSLVGATGTLSQYGLGNAGAYGPFTPANQKVYIFMQGCSHTFNLGPTNFPMLPATAISYTDQWGSAVSGCLYESVAPQSAPISSLTLAS